MVCSLQMKSYKCKEVPFHGHLLTREGLKPDPEKVRAIVEMPRPNDRDDILLLNGIRLRVVPIFPQG